MALYAPIRRQRVRMSWMVTNSACPMCREPVTFGGGMTIENGAFGICASAWKYFCSSQKRYHFCSTCWGSYDFGNSFIARLLLLVREGGRKRRLLAALFYEAVE